jgi:hypothetical protein
LYFHLTEEEQSTFSIDISEDNKQQDFSSQLGQQEDFQGRHLSTNREPVMEGQLLSPKLAQSKLSFLGDRENSKKLFLNLYRLVREPIVCK